jgi:hypothetical protein
MVQSGNGLRFTLEPFGETVGGCFDGHVALDARVPCAKHLAL